MDGFLDNVPPSVRKPNPCLLLDICASLRVRPSETVYVGDSLIMDVSMARQAGMVAVWAKYGTEYDRSLWDVIIRVTHWSPEDVGRDEELQHRYAGVRPDRTIDICSGILSLFPSQSYRE